MSTPTHFQEPLPAYAEPNLSGLADLTGFPRAPITCLGQTFASEDERRAYFRARLAGHLAGPAFHQIEGFPIGEDEAILNLSDPPYYTACPNPFLPEILAEWERGRGREEETQGRSEGDTPQSSLTNPPYHREPFAADVSEGKNDPIYNAHSYHTKVPHKAIMRYILHYTEPGDIVFDGFCGSGMTGVAAQLCGDKKAVESLGYFVAPDGAIYEHPPLATPQSPITISHSPISRLGPRRAVLIDLSPAATFIAYNYNTPVDAATFEREARRILREVEEECGWMYETWHPHCDHPQRVKARINYTIWSDVFLCPECSAELVLWDVAVDPTTRRVKDSFMCPGCTSVRTKDSLHRAHETYFDPSESSPASRAKRVPVLIAYSVGQIKYEKIPDPEDLHLLQVISSQQLRFPIPNRRIDQDIDLWYERDYRTLGIFSVSDFYTRRNLLMNSYVWHRAHIIPDVRLRNSIMVWVQSVSMGFSLLNRYLENAFSQVNRLLSGTLYVGSFISEVSPWYALRGKIRRMATMASGAMAGGACLSTCSSTERSVPENSLDYVFIDPPFGSNIIYSDLSIVWESWLRLFTNAEDEAVVHRRKKTGHLLSDYQELMSEAFQFMYAALKPVHWITIEFHNTRNSVWNAIQEALLRAGFVVADVRKMDKELATFKQVTAAGAVKQDLVISAYKPNGGLEERFRLEAGTAEGVWDFVRQHLRQLPTVVEQDGVLETLAERQDYLLFDRMVAFHIQRGASVPLSASEFYAGLRQRFVPRDGMFFLPDQVPAYDQARLQAEHVAQLSLFVSDEKSARQWLRQQLDPALGGQPQTYQDLQPAFLRQLHQARHEALPELSVLLEQSFLQDDRDRWYAPDPGRAADLEALRRKALLREFEGYRQGKGRLKLFRTEAVRAGFAHCWQQADYAAILALASRLPEAVLQEDAELMMYVDNAGLRVR